VAGSCEYGNEPSGSGSTELVIQIIRIQSSRLSDVIISVLVGGPKVRGFKPG
jgi:hypothetical protein